MPVLTYSRSKTIECSEKALVIAKAMHAYTYYPGRQVSEAEWPPTTNSALVRYVTMGKAIEAALEKAGYR